MHPPARHDRLATSVPFTLQAWSPSSSVWAPCCLWPADYQLTYRIRTAINCHCLFHPSGLVAQQQCVGPLQLPLSNVAVFAQSHQDLSGLATSIGEQPLKGLISPAAMARLSLGEALTNLVWARATSLQVCVCVLCRSLGWPWGGAQRDH